MFTWAEHRLEDMNSVCEMQARLSADLQTKEQANLAKLEAGLKKTLELLRGLQAQMGACQSPQGLQIHCSRSQILKVGTRCKLMLSDC